MISKQLYISALGFLLAVSCSCNRNVVEKNTVVVENTKPPVPTKTIVDTVVAKSLDRSQNEDVKTTKGVISAEIEILSATSQKWTGGIKGSGSGVNYVFVIVVPLSLQELVIDELWIGETFHKPQISKNENLGNLKFQAGDTLYIYASDYFKSPDNPKLDTNEQPTEPETFVENMKPPYKYSGAALIGYTVGGERKYKTIDIITAIFPQKRP